MSRKKRAQADMSRRQKLEKPLAPIRAQQDLDHEAAWKRILAIPVRKRTAADKRMLQDLAGMDILRQALYPAAGVAGPRKSSHAKP